MPPRQRQPANKPPAANRAVLYVRVSDLMGRGGDDFHSPDLQLGAMRRLVKTNGLREVAVVQDIDVTGRTFNREGLDRVRTMVEAREVDVLAVYDLARLGRNAGESLRFIAWLREHQVRIVSTVEQFQDTPEGQLALGLFLGMAELYSNQVARRWAEVIAHRAQKGHHHGGLPLGYLRDSDGNVHPDATLAPAAARVFRDYADGVTVAETARRFSRARGVATSIVVIKGMLLNPFYTGKVVLWGVGRGRRPNVHDTPLFVGPGLHDAIVEDETFDACQVRLRRDSFTVARHLDPSHSLVGLVVCAHCEYLMQLHNDPRGTGVYRLQCGSKRASKSELACAGPGSPQQRQVEEVVLLRVQEYIALLTGDVAARAQALARANQVGSTAEVLRKRLARVRGQMQKLTQGWLAERVPDVAYDTQIEQLREQEEHLVAQIAEVDCGPPPLPPTEVVSLGDRLLRAWPDATSAERNVLLRKVIRRVKVRRAQSYREPVAGRIEVEFL